MKYALIRLHDFIRIKKHDFAWARPEDLINWIQLIIPIFFVHGLRGKSRILLIEQGWMKGEANCMDTGCYGSWPTLNVKDDASGI